MQRSDTKVVTTEKKIEEKPVPGTMAGTTGNDGNDAFGEHSGSTVRPSGCPPPVSMERFAVTDQRRDRPSLSVLEVAPAVRPREARLNVFR
jgi:hypothetical protein